MKRLILISLAVFAIAAPAAAKSVTLAVSPESPSVGQQFTISGCGYTRLTTIIVWHAGTGPYQEVTPDSDGCISATFTAWSAGDYLAQAWQERGKVGSHLWEQKPSAELVFAVS